MRRAFMAAAAFALLGMTGAATAAPTFTLTNFDNITGTNAEDLGAGHLSVGVTGAIGSQTVLFEFFNNVGIGSSITDVYFADDLGLFLTPITTITDSGAGVDFSVGAAPPALPAGASNGFVTTAGLTADSNSPTAPNGVNLSTEWLGILLTLAEGNTFADFLLSGFLGTFQIGMHVQSIGALDGSDSYINGGPGGGFPDPQIAPVPIPGALLLFGSALAGLGLLSRKRARKSNMNLAA